MNNETGQALPLAIMALALGTLLITPFLGHASSSLVGSRVYEQGINEGYSGDAGVEHALWNLTNGGLAEQLTEPGDSITYQLSETVNGIAPSITVTANITGGEGGAAGDIGDTVIDTLLFDTTYGEKPDIVHISGSIFAIAYPGNWNKGLLKTVEIASDGEITDSTIDTLMFDNWNCYYPDIIHVSGSIFAIAYQGAWSQGYLKTVEIAPDGEITDSIIDTLTFDNWNCYYPDVIHVSGNIYTIAYRSGWSQGYLKTLEIAPDGEITGSVIDTLMFDTSNCYYPDIIHVSGSIFAIAYQGAWSQGYLKTLEIAPDGEITDSIIDTLVFDSRNCYYPDIIHVSGSVYAIAYRGDWNKGLLKTLEIASDGEITDSTIDTLTFDNWNCYYPDIIYVSGSIFAIAYQGAWSQGSLKTLEIAPDGEITDSIIDTLVFDTGNCYYPDIIHVSGNVYAIAYSSGWSQGYLKTLEIATSGGSISAAYEIESTAGDKTIRAFVNTTNETVSIISWQIE